MQPKPARVDFRDVASMSQSDRPSGKRTPVVGSSGMENVSLIKMSSKLPFRSNFVIAHPVEIYGLCVPLGVY